MNYDRSDLAEVRPRVLTRDGVFTDGHWPMLEAGAERVDSDPALLPLAVYLAQEPSPVHGVWLAPTDDPAALDAHLATVPLVAVRFPKFADGRGYSIAVLLRRRGYRGDLRAVGEVLVDQLFMLKRVGFTSFAVPSGQSDDSARAALNRYSDAYQAAYDIDLPPYRRGRR